MSSVALAMSSDESSDGAEIRVELVTHDKNSKSFFAQLQASKDEIEREIGQSLNWHNPSDARSCRIYVRRPADIFNEEQWLDQHQWLRENLERFHRVFGPRVRKLEVQS